ncbi:MAG: LacI family DNA-binding transcriptional regulator [Phycisphaerae bacterium]
MQKNKANLKKIAEKVDLSLMTVSRALRNSPLVSPKTRDRVMAVAEKLHYRPNMLMVGVRTGRSRTAGVIVPPSATFHNFILEGIHDELADADYAMMLSWNKTNIASAGDMQERRFIHRLLEHRVDGIILRPTLDKATDDYFSEIWEQNVPLIVVDRRLHGVRCDFVGTDDEAVGWVAAAHLMSLGHRRLGHLAGPATVSTAQLRRRGFELAAARTGEGVATTVHEAPQFEDVVEDAILLLRTRPRPTAVFAANDDGACCVMEAARKLGLKIPEDLSVIGCGNLISGKLADPPLTTFDQHPYRVGRRAAGRLMERIRSSRTIQYETIEIAPELVLRASTAPPKN